MLLVSGQSPGRTTIVDTGTQSFASPLTNTKSRIELKRVLHWLLTLIAQSKWRRLNGAGLIVKLLDGCRFVDGIAQNKEEKDAA